MIAMKFFKIWVILIIDIVLNSKMIVNNLVNSKSFYMTRRGCCEVK